MHISNDLVYKLMLSNTTDQRVMYKITFEDLGEDVNLRWPINGIKGSLDRNFGCALFSSK